MPARAEPDLVLDLELVLDQVQVEVQVEVQDQVMRKRHDVPNLAHVLALE